jgi:hypothetical protein
MKLDRNESVKYNYLRKRAESLQKQYDTRRANLEKRHALNLQLVEDTLGKELARTKAEIAPLEEKKAAE